MTKQQMRANYLWFKMNNLCDDLLGGGEEYDPFAIEEVRAAFEDEIEQWEQLAEESAPPEPNRVCFSCKQWRPASQFPAHVPSGVGNDICRFCIQEL